MFCLLAYHVNSDNMYMTTLVKAVSVLILQILLVHFLFYSCNDNISIDVSLWLLC